MIAPFIPAAGAPGGLVSAAAPAPSPAPAGDGFDLLLGHLSAALLATVAEAADAAGAEASLSSTPGTEPHASTAGAVTDDAAELLMHPAWVATPSLMEWPPVTSSRTHDDGADEIHADAASGPPHTARSSLTGTAAPTAGAAITGWPFDATTAPSAVAHTVVASAPIWAGALPGPTDHGAEEEAAAPGSAPVSAARATGPLPFESIAPTRTTGPLPADTIAPDRVSGPLPAEAAPPTRSRGPLPFELAPHQSTADDALGASASASSASALADVVATMADPTPTSPRRTAAGLVEPSPTGGSVARSQRALGTYERAAAEPRAAHAAASTDAVASTFVGAAEVAGARGGDPTVRPTTPSTRARGLMEAIERNTARHEGATPPGLIVAVARVSPSSDTDGDGAVSASDTQRRRVSRAPVAAGGAVAPATAPAGSVPAPAGGTHAAVLDRSVLVMPGPGPSGRWVWAKVDGADLTSPLGAPAAASASPVVPLGLFERAPVADVCVAIETPEVENRTLDATTGESVHGQIIRSLKVQWSGGLSEARVTLRPEFLGDVVATISVEQGVVTATLQADTPEVRRWMEAHTTSLRDALVEHGLTLDRLTVSEPAREPGDADRQGRSRGRQPQDAPPRPRRRPADGPTPQFELTS